MDGLEGSEGLSDFLVVGFSGFDSARVVGVGCLDVVGEEDGEGSFEPFFFQNLISGGILGPLELFEEFVVFAGVFLFHPQGRLYHLVVITVDVLEQLDSSRLVPTLTLDRRHFLARWLG